VLRTCCERVANAVTSNIRSLSQPHPMLLLYYEHVATSVACNIQHQELSSLSSTQIPTSHVCTSKLNIHNIKI
jgi:hypothetical protein